MPMDGVPQNLGVYGTLLDAEIRAMVFGEAGLANGHPATLPGWSRWYVAGERYPGIRRSPGSSIDVLIFTDVSTRLLERADSFEGDEYARVLLPVELANGGGQLQAMFYVPSPAITLSDVPWVMDSQWIERFRAAFLAEAKEALAGRRSVVAPGGPGC